MLLNKRKKHLQAHDTIANDVKRLINDQTPFAVKEAYRSLCTNVLYLSIEDKCKKICITSALSGEGKTSVSINFAITLAQHSDNIKVLLVDADLRKSRISYLLDGIDSDTHGLTEYLAGIDQIPNIVETKFRNLSIITSGAESVNPAALLNSSKMKNLVNSLEDTYDYIIFDTPPVNVVSDAVILNELVNGYLIVARADYSDVRTIDQTVEALKQVGANIFGFVLDSLNLKSKNPNRKYKNHYGDYASNNSNEANSYEKTKQKDSE